MTQDSKLSDSSAKQEVVEYSDWATGNALDVWGPQLFHQRSVYYQAVLYIGYVTTNLSYVTLFIIWIHKCYKITAIFKTLGLFTFRGKQTTLKSTMISIFILVALSALGTSTVVGFITNAFIIVVHGMDRAKGRNINPRELILFSLGLFNIAFQCTMVANDTVLFLWGDLYFSDNVYAIFSVLLLFIIFSSFWFTFCLCGFYYVMLITSEHKLLRRLKQGISKVVPWMLNSSILLSLVISFPVAWNIMKDGGTNQFQGNLTYNSTAVYITPHMNLYYLLVTSIIGCCVPLVLVAVSNILIIKSLCVHAKNLGKTAGGMSVQSVDASISAARTITSLLILYITFYISQILLIMGVFDVNSLWFSLGLIIIYAYSPIQSVILIHGSPKLKSTLLRLLGLLKSTQDKQQHEKLNPQIFSLHSSSTGN